MKKSLFTLSILLISVNVLGQDDEKMDTNKNEIALEISDLINSSFQLKYERLLGEHFSVSFGVGLKGKEGLIKLSGLDTEHIKTSDLTYSGFKIIPEVRYYLNKTRQYSMDGFYFGSFVKYTNFTSDIDGTYINDAGENFILAFDADLRTVSVGFMVGYKWAISKRFSLDFLIVGPGVGFYKYSLNNTQDLPDEFYDDLNEALDQYSIFDLLDSDFKFSSTNVDSNFTLPSLRYGISLGYSF